MKVPVEGGGGAGMLAFSLYGGGPTCCLVSPQPVGWLSIYDSLAQTF
jgi:hypothetical protein